MVLKLIFYSKVKNNTAWWDRLYDRFNKIKDRKWTLHGGGKLGEDTAEFTFKYPDGTLIKDQKSVNEIVWIFVIEQINVDKFIVNGNDVTKQLKNR